MGKRRCEASPVANSSIPTIGYTIPYAVSRIVLAFSEVIIILLMR